MGEIISVAPPDLEVDVNNPRLSESQESQRKAQRAIAHDQQARLVVLANDIVERGLDLSTLPIVQRVKRGNSYRYVVLEGNRRLTALRALENPELFVGAVSNSVLKSLRELSTRYRDKPIEEVTCVEMSTEEANHWIRLRHTGHNGGAGVIPWRAEDAARFGARTGRTELYVQAIDLLESQGLLSPTDRKKIKVTNLKRLLGTPEVRERIGIGLDNGQLRILGNESKAARAIKYIVDDLNDRDVKVGEIYSRKQRIKYAKSIPNKFVAAVKTSTSKKKITTKRRRQKKAKRIRLIPPECELQSRSPRAIEIEEELRWYLHLDDHTNAVAVLFRVFVELSADDYLHRNRSVDATRNSNLRHKLNRIAEHLVSRDALTREEAEPVRKAAQKNEFLGASIDQFNAYVHNQYVFPAAGDLRAYWDSLQPFMIAMMS